MKTTLQIPDQLLREAKASAAMRHASLKEFVCGAIREKLRMEKRARFREVGWRAVFGAARAAQTTKIDRLIKAEFGKIEHDSWK